jgi:hypothetical protein
VGKNDAVLLSELFVLAVLDQLGGPTAVVDLPAQVRLRLSVADSTTGFSLGEHSTVGDLLTELQAFGAVELQDGGNPLVELTDHGRSLLQEAKAHGFDNLKFA